MQFLPHIFWGQKKEAPLRGASLRTLRAASLHISLLTLYLCATQV